SEFTPGVRDAELIALLDEALARLPPGDGALRARCLAQLAAERQPEADPEPVVELARQAVAMARRSADYATPINSPPADSVALRVYTDPSERSAYNAELGRLALAAGNRRGALRGDLLQTLAYWELGDPATAMAHARAYAARTAEQRHGRSLHWVVAHLEA